MPFDLRVPGAKPFNVGRVECKKFQARLLPGNKRARSSLHRQVNLPGALPSWRGLVRTALLHRP
jgi:hypothetical protein